MPSKGKQTLERIHLKLRQKSKDKDGSQTLTPEEIKRVIRDEAGFSKQVVKKYWNILKRRDKIEPIPNKEKNKWIINQPKIDTVETSGETTTVTLNIDRNLKEACEEFGIALRPLLEDKIIQELEVSQEFILDLTGEYLSEEEARFVMKLIAHGLHKKGGRTKEIQETNQKLRRELYEEVFDRFTVEDAEHLKELTESAWSVAEKMDITPSIS